MLFFSFIGTSEKHTNIKLDPFTFDQIEGNDERSVTNLEIEHREFESSIQNEEEIAQYGKHSTKIYLKKYNSFSQIKKLNFITFIAFTR